MEFRKRATGGWILTETKWSIRKTNMGYWIYYDSNRYSDTGHQVDSPSFSSASIAKQFILYIVYNYPFQIF